MDGLRYSVISAPPKAYVRNGCGQKWDGSANTHPARITPLECAGGLPLTNNAGYRFTGPFQIRRARAYASSPGSANRLCWTMSAAAPHRGHCRGRRAAGRGPVHQLIIEAIDNPATIRFGWGERNGLRFRRSVSRRCRVQRDRACSRIASRQIAARGAGRDNKETHSSSRISPSANEASQSSVCGFRPGQFIPITHGASPLYTQRG